MLDLDRIKEIWETISRNKIRSFLTGFGVFWALFMFVFMLGIGRGFEQGIISGISTSMTNSLFVMSNSTSIEYKGFNANRYWSLNENDVERIAKMPQVENVSPLIFSGSHTVAYEDKKGNYSMRGNDDKYYKIDAQPLVHGRYFNKIDVDQNRKVCILGYKIYNDLFPARENPVGKRLMVSGITFTVVGVVNASGKFNIGGNANEMIFVPSSTIQKMLNLGTNVHAIFLAAKDNINSKELEKELEIMLKAYHIIAPNDSSAVRIFNMQDFFVMFKYLFLGINILIWIVGMGTLFSGAVGVSNIMLVSVKERTSEIGIKRALGAKPSNIMTQIMSESLILTFIAGFLGLFFGVLVLAAINSFIPNPEAGAQSMFKGPSISFMQAIMASVIVLISGLIAGVMPARNSLSIKAIDAIRSE